MKNSIYNIQRIITLLFRNIQRELKYVMEPFDISVGEEPYFTELIYEDGITQEELTSKVNVDKAATARAVKSLEDKGLIFRVVDKKDRRSKRVYLTETARIKSAPLCESLQAYDQMFIKELSKEEFDKTYECLRRLYNKSEKRR